MGIWVGLCSLLLWLSQASSVYQGMPSEWNLAGSAGRTWDSSSWGWKFKPYTGCRYYLKKKEKCLVKTRREEGKRPECRGREGKEEGRNEWKEGGRGRERREAN